MSNDKLKDSRHSAVRSATDIIVGRRRMRHLLKSVFWLTLLMGMGMSFALAQSSKQMKTNEQAATVKSERKDPPEGFATPATQSADTYCKDNSDTYPPCDEGFKNKCSGTMSGPQGWGGQTCFTTSGGRAVE